MQSSFPRKRERLAKLFNETKSHLYDEVVGAFQRRIYFDATGTVTNYIKTQFSQPEYRAVKDNEQFTLNLMNRFEYQNFQGRSSFTFRHL